MSARQQKLITLIAFFEIKLTVMYLVIRDSLKLLVFRKTHTFFMCIKATQRCRLLALFCAIEEDFVCEFLVFTTQVLTTHQVRKTER